MQSLRARAARRAFAASMGVIRAYRNRRLGIGEMTPDAVADLFEDGALEIRKVFEQLTALSRTVVGVTEHELATTPVRSWWFEPDRPTQDRTVLYLHGGAYVAGSHGTHRVLASAVARVAGADVLLPEYRLAPEHLFPAAVEDAVATYRWLLDEGVDPSLTVVAGDSAGGGLAVATVVAARDEGLPLPAGLACMSPWVDLTGSGDTVVDNDELDLWLDGPLIAVGGAKYAPEDPTHPYASPLFADLTGLPPMLVHVGTHEVLLDDARRLVAAARAAGVDASLGEFDGMWHVFQAFLGLPETTRSLREIGGFIRRVTDPALAVPEPD